LYYFKSIKTAITAVKILTRLYSIYSIAVFIGLSVLFLIPLLIIAQKEKWHPLALKINHYWAILFFKCSFIPYKITYHTKLARGQQYILCANHFSFLDIPSMGLLPASFKFYGKSSLSSIPLFGYMYRKIHITVNRSSLKSIRYSFNLARQALERGFNLAIFPEGGIVSKSPPTMNAFKDGAFQLAAQKQVPILPVTFINNFRILPDDDQYMFHRNLCKIVVHRPVFPRGNTDESVEQLKYQVYTILQNELDQVNKMQTGR